MGLEERETGLFVIIKVSKVIIQTDKMSDKYVYCLLYTTPQTAANKS
jgi:hypothetical protein